MRKKRLVDKIGSDDRRDTFTPAVSFASTNESPEKAERRNEVAAENVVHVVGFFLGGMIAQQLEPPPTGCTSLVGF